LPPQPRKRLWLRSTSGSSLRCRATQRPPSESSPISSEKEPSWWAWRREATLFAGLETLLAAASFAINPPFRPAEKGRAPARPRNPPTSPRATGGPPTATTTTSGHDRRSQGLSGIVTQTWKSAFHASFLPTPTYLGEAKVRISTPRRSRT